MLVRARARKTKLASTHRSERKGLKRFVLYVGARRAFTTVTGPAVRRDSATPTAHLARLGREVPPLVVKEGLPGLGLWVGADAAAGLMRRREHVGEGVAVAVGATAAAVVVAVGGQRSNLQRQEGGKKRNN